ncbi:MAG: triose-phosphate isomerase [bacterium]
MRKAIIAGNWKMNMTCEQARDLTATIKSGLSGPLSVDVVIIPPYTALDVVNNLIHGSQIMLGAQNMYYEEMGAYTGEISPLMLKSCGCRYCIIGHSERRQYFGETDESINKKIKVALKHDLIPICCIGETLEQREEGKTFAVVEQQIKMDLEGLSDEEMGRTIIAYEPIWAIGTGKTATPEQANEVHAFIRSQLVTIFNAQLAEMVRIQYGGSVKPDNIDGLMAQKDIDGALVGGASLKADAFTRIVKFDKI